MLEERDWTLREGNRGVWNGRKEDEGVCLFIKEDGCERDESLVGEKQMSKADEWRGRENIGSDCVQASVWLYPFPSISSQTLISVNTYTLYSSIHSPIYLTIHSLIHLTIHPSVHPSIHPSTLPFHLSFCPSICVSSHFSIHSPILPTHSASIHPSVNPSVHPARTGLGGLGVGGRHQ